MNRDNIKKLGVISNEARKLALEAVYCAQSGHPGGSLSITDVLTVLYFEIMNVDEGNPRWEDRDRFVLSKGHCTPALYSILALKGFFPVEEIKNFRKIDSFLQGHPDMKNIPGVDMSTGSLGQGISAANGMAIAAKIFGKGYHVYAILGDGELEEGQVWEAAMFAAHYKLDNLTAFIDYNGLQIDGSIDEVMSPNPIDEKFRSFGWNVITIDGHDYNQILSAVHSAKAIKEKPTAIILKTIKGKGVSFMENNPYWHGTAPKKEEYELAVNEVDAVISELEGV